MFGFEECVDSVEVVWFGVDDGYFEGFFLIVEGVCYNGFVFFLVGL